MAGAQAVLHLATRIAPASAAWRRSASRENDRIRVEGTQNLEQCALATRVEVLVYPSFAPIDADGGSPLALLRGPASTDRRSRVDRRCRRAGERVHRGQRPGRRTQLASGLAVAVGRRRVRRLPTPVVRAALGGRMEFLLRSQRVSNRRFVEATGWNPRIADAADGLTRLPSAAGGPGRRLTTPASSHRRRPRHARSRTRCGATRSRPRRSPADGPIDGGARQRRPPRAGPANSPTTG